jgi:hypothetical protein
MRLRPARQAFDEARREKARALLLGRQAALRVDERVIGMLQDDDLHVAIARYARCCHGECGGHWMTTL